MTLADELLKRTPPRTSEGRVIRFYQEEELPDPISNPSRRWMNEHPERVKVYRQRWNEKRRMKRLEMLNRRYFGA